MNRLRLGFRACRLHALRNDKLARASFSLDLRLGRRTKRMRADSKLPSQFPAAEDFYACAGTIRQPCASQGLRIHARAISKMIEGFKIDWQIASCMTRIVESALGDAPYQRHLATFKANADRTARTGGLALAAPATGLAVAAAFTLAQSFATMPGARTRMEIV